MLDFNRGIIAVNRESSRIVESCIIASGGDYANDFGRFTILTVENRDLIVDQNRSIIVA